MAGPTLDPEAAPLRRGAGSQATPAASSSGRTARPPQAVRSLVGGATLYLAASAAASGLALWVRTGRMMGDPVTGRHSTMHARVTTAAPVVKSNAGGAAADAGGRPSPPFHTAAAEWWAAMVAPYPGAARAEAFSSLRAQDDVEATAAGARFAAAAAMAADPTRRPPPGAPYSGNPADYALTPAKLATVAGPPPGTSSGDGGGPASPPYITITWCNAAFVPFALNWAAHARAAGVGPFLVGASDEAALEQLLAAGLPTFAMPRLVGKGAGLAQTSPRDLGWGSPAFHALGREKAATAAAVTGSGYGVLLTDVDMVFLRDPAPYFARFPDAALLTSSDGLHRTTTGGAAQAPPPPALNASGLAVAVSALAVPGAGDGLEIWPAALDGAAGNIGIMLWRAHAHPVAVAWRDALIAEPGAWDQDVFNDLLRAGTAGNETAAAATASPGLFRTFGRAAPMPAAALAGVLPVDTFASGHTHFVQRLAERTGQDPYAVHATFQFSGTVGKRHRLRERWLWAVDGNTHYAPRGGLVTLGPLEEIPAVARLLGVVAGVPAQSSHFALVHAQLAILRAGLAVAASLDRTLVLPRFWCGVDRWWARHAGVIPGTTAPARLPFRCPADHILDLAAMADEGLDEAEYGRRIAYREAGLPENPRFPAASRAPGPGGTVAVVVGRGGRASADGAATIVVLPAALDDVALRSALAPHAPTPVLHFPDPAAAFGGFSDQAVAARFLRRVSISTDLWCCDVGTGKPIWYDAQADIDHTDRHGRAWKGGEWVGMAEQV